MSGFKMAARKKVYARRGKPFRWFVPVRVDGETRYREQLRGLDDTLISDCRVVTWDNQESLEAASFGQVAQKQTMLSFIPSQVTQHAGHLTLLTDPRCAIDARDTFRRSGDFNVLPHWPCAGVLDIYAEGVLVDASTYSSTPEGIQWLEGAPEEDAEFDVRWWAFPLYEWMESERGHLQLGDTEALPQRGQVRLQPDFDPSLILNQ